MTSKKETPKTLASAICYVQTHAPIIGKETKNPFFKSNYADLPTIWKAIKDLMSEAGLTVYTITDFDDQMNEFVITTIEGHGEKLSSRSMVMLKHRTPQEYGSFLTYIRRYHLSSMMGLQVDEDDDGNAASAKPSEKPKPKPKAEPKKELTTTQKWLQDAKKQIEAITSPDGVTLWFHDANFPKDLSEKQEQWLNGIAKKHKEELEGFMKDA